MTVMSDDEKVQLLIKYAGDSAFDMEEARAYLRWVIEGQLWREFLSPNGNRMVNTSFAEFVTAPKWQGLEATVEAVKTIAAGDTGLLDLLDQALKGKQGTRTDLVDNIHEVERPSGTSEAAGLRRLRKNRPDLHAKVLKNELSAHAAMVAAGYRPRTITIRADDPQSIARTLRKQLAPQTLAALREALA